MYYLIQENLFKESHFNILINCLKNKKLEYEIIPFKPFTEEIDFKTKRKDVWCFGSTNLAKVAKKYNWFPGSMYNENHNYEIYSQYYKHNLLNYDGEIIEISDSLPEKIKNLFFARPTLDTKSFSGQVFTKDSWYNYIKDLKNSNLLQNLNNETKVLIANLKDDIQQEIRCWVVNGKVISLSQYKIGRRVVYLNMDHNKEVVFFVEDIIKLFQPAKAFVIDICLYQDEYKIVEINTINCSGFYNVNIENLINSLEETFNIKNYNYE